MKKIFKYMASSKSPKDEKVKVYYLPGEKREAFIDEIIPGIFECYVDIKELKKCAREQNMMPMNVFVELYLPKENNNIKSGDFGEILTYHLAVEKYEDIIEYAPMKWRYKESKEKASPCTDVILFCSNEEKLSILSYEVKVRATRYVDKTVENAVKEAEKDRISRIARTIVYLKRKCFEKHKRKEMNVINKFENLLDKECKISSNAVVIGEMDTIEKCHAELNEQLYNQYDKITITTITIDNLFDMISEIYEKLAKNETNIK